jgi:hypothetical protein
MSDSTVDAGIVYRQHRMVQKSLHNFVLDGENGVTLTTMFEERILQYPTSDGRQVQARLKSAG